MMLQHPRYGAAQSDIETVCEIDSLVQRPKQFGISGLPTTIEHCHNEMAFSDGLGPKDNSNVDRLGYNWKNDF
jgi:hypothetical protein